jgi:hypothetical protein
MPAAAGVIRLLGSPSLALAVACSGPATPAPVPGAPGTYDLAVCRGSPCTAGDSGAIVHFPLYRSPDAFHAVRARVVADGLVGGGASAGRCHTPG